MKLSKKKGQVTVYIIIALAIVAVILVIILYPRIKNVVSSQQVSPNNFLQSCIQPQIASSIALLGAQGGYANPEGYIKYQGAKVKYLCYTSENYKTCVVQQPAVKTHFQKELQSMVLPVAEKCEQNLKETYQSKGYSVSQRKLNVSVSIVPNNVRLNFATPMAITKNGKTQTYNGFVVNVPSGMYTLLFVAQSIVQYEAVYGNSDTNLYLRYYPNLRILKNQLDDGTRVYTLQNVITNENFTFASRSLVFPPGYGNA